MGEAKSRLDGTKRILVCYPEFAAEAAAGRMQKTRRRASLQNRNAAAVLEPLRQRHIPGSPLDIGRRLIVAVFASARDERRCQVEDVVYAERNRCVIKPCAPSKYTRTINPRYCRPSDKGGWVFGRT
jgi:hypothetical protein